MSDIGVKEGKHRSWKYDILHELGHMICGYGCCREHCEFEAHGAAKALAFLLEINIGDAEERMSCYAGRTNIHGGGCGRYKTLNLEKPTTLPPSERKKKVGRPRKYIKEAMRALEKYPENFKRANRMFMAHTGAHRNTLRNYVMNK